MSEVASMEYYSWKKQRRDTGLIGGGLPGMGPFCEAN